MAAADAEASAGRHADRHSADAAVSAALGGLTSPQVGSRAGAVLAVPLGSTEQHGPHLPVSTDTDIAVALCERLAEVRDVVVAPPLPYGSSGEHAGFPGTLSIGQDALELLLLELCRSACESFARVLLVSGHGGNAAPLARAVERLRFEGRDVLAWSPSWSGDAHAGRTETSLQLALGAPLDLAAAEPGDTRPLHETLPLLMGGGVVAVSPNGVLGDPRGASAAEGEALLHDLTAQLVAAFDHWPDHKVVELVETPGLSRRAPASRVETLGLSRRAPARRVETTVTA